MTPKYLVYLKDGRIGLGYKYKYRGLVYYNVNGFGFSLGDVRKFEIKKLQVL